MKSPPSRRFTVVLLAVAASTASALGQAPLPTTKPQPAEEESVLLSPFLITSERETGYTPANSLTGSRAGLRIAETPYSISVLTRDLLDDLGVTDLQSALGLFGGVSTQEETQGANAFNDYNINVRNFGTSNGTTGGTTPPTRNYFEVHFNFDSYNLERLELSRGPNSFFNSNQSFGSVNSATKTALLSRSITDLTVRASDWGGGRATLDVNRPLTTTLAVRLNALWDDQDGWREVDRTKKVGLHFTATYKPTRQTELRAEYEYGKTDRWVAFGVIDQASLWDGVTAPTAPLTANPAGSTGLSRFTTDQWTYNPAVSSSSFINWRNFAQSNGTTRQVLGANRVSEDTEVSPNPILFNGSRLLLPSDRFTWVTPNIPASNPVRNVALYAVHQISPDLAVEMAGSWFRQERNVLQAGNLFQDYRVDVNRNRPDGTPNPYFGQAYTEARVANEFQSNDYYNGRAQLAWSPSWEWLKARLLAGVEYNWSNFRQKTWVYVNDTGSGTLAGNTGAHIIRARRYLSERTSDFVFPTNAPGMGLRTALTGGPNNWSQGFSYAYRFAFTGSWLRSGRLKTIGAIRFDERYTEAFDGLAADARGEYNLPTVIKRGRANKYDTSYNGGVTYSLLRNVNAYASYGMNTPNPNNAFNIAGGSLPAGKREGLEGGIKASFLDERVGVAVNYFVNERLNEATTELSTGTTDFDLLVENIWTLVGQPRDLSNTFSDVRTYQSSGWELEVTANPIRPLSVRLNFSIGDSSVDDEFSLTRAYLDANRSAWTQAANNLNATDRQTVLNTLASLDTAVESIGTGRRLRNSFDYTGSAVVTYRFDAGRLRGLSVTGSGVFRGERAVNQYPRGFPLPDGRAAGPYDFYMADAYATYSLNVAYRTRLWNRPTRLQLSISNLFDDQTFLPSSANVNSLSRVDATTGRVSTTGSIVLPNRFSYVNPRQISLTTSVSF